MTSNKLRQNSSALKFMLGLAAFVIVIAGIKSAEQIIVPFLLSMFIAIICAPAMFWLQSRKVPLGIDLTLVIIVIVLLNFGLGVLVSSSLKDFYSNNDLYQQRINEMLPALLHWLARWHITIPDNLLKDQFNPGLIMKLAGQVFGAFSSVLTNAFLILLTVIFLLLEASSAPTKIKAAMKNPQNRFDEIEKVLDTVKNYMMLKTIISLGTGVAIFLWLRVQGVNYPVLWAVLAFLLNFVPNIGSIIAAVPAVILSLVQLGISSALITALGFALVNIIVGNVIEPRYMGKGLGLSTLVVFLSLIFWGWVLGPVGMFLSVPLTMTLKIICGASEQTKWISILLGNEASCK